MVSFELFTYFKSHRTGDLTPAETRVDNLPFAKVLDEENLKITTC